MRRLLSGGARPSNSPKTQIGHSAVEPFHQSISYHHARAENTTWALHPMATTHAVESKSGVRSFIIPPCVNTNVADTRARTPAGTNAERAAAATAPHAAAAPNSLAFIGLQSTGTDDACGGGIAIAAPGMKGCSVTGTSKNTAKAGCEIVTTGYLRQAPSVFFAGNGDTGSSTLTVRSGKDGTKLLLSSTSPRGNYHVKNVPFGRRSLEVQHGSRECGRARWRRLHENHAETMHEFTQATRPTYTPRFLSRIWNRSLLHNDLLSAGAGVDLPHVCRGGSSRSTPGKDKKTSTPALAKTNLPKSTQKGTCVELLQDGHAWVGQLPAFHQAPLLEGQRRCRCSERNLCKTRGCRFSAGIPNRVQA